ncbi:MAG: hypothetical protein DRO96_03080 [Candidatus Aenigmatarchaeota archaeon]|nr:MAG: hypothetical protein DRO96_03080 [Candidatus Aenigmarchaeota archaeon]
MWNWFLNEFWNPFLRDGSYTLGETLVYALVFVFFAYYALQLFRKLDVALDRNFFIGWSLWILAMAATRVLEDYGILASRLFITPYLDFLFGGTVLALIVILKHLERKKKLSFSRAWVASPFFVLVPAAVFLPVKNITGAATVLLLVFAFWLSFNLLKHTHILKKFLSPENRAVLLAHIFDASATVTAIQFFSAYEKHVLPAYLIGVFGPWIMFPLKIAVVCFVLYYIDREKEQTYEIKYIKILVFSLGFGTGARDLLQILGY